MVFLLLESINVTFYRETVFSVVIELKVKLPLIMQVGLGAITFPYKSQREKTIDRR